MIGDVLDVMAAHAGPFRERFELQRAHCRLVEYVETPGGCYAVLDTNRQFCEPLAGGRRGVITGVWGANADFPLGGDFLVLVEDGYISLFECSRIAPPWGPVPQNTVFQLTCDADLEASLRRTLAD